MQALALLHKFMNSHHVFFTRYTANVMDFSSTVSHFFVVITLSILVKNLMYCLSLPVGMDNGPMGKELLYQCNSWSYKWELLSNNV